MDKSAYSLVLVAVDFDPAGDAVIARGLALRHGFGAQLILLHVVEHVPPAMEFSPLGFAGDATVPDGLALEEELVALARSQLDALGTRIGVAPADRIIHVGPVGPMIAETAATIGADLVLVGSHRRHGLLGLFGSTAKAALRSVHCDVLCVRTGEQAEQ